MCVCDIFEHSAIQRLQGVILSVTPLFARKQRSRGGAGVTVVKVGCEGRVLFTDP